MTLAGHLLRATPRLVPAVLLLPILAGLTGTLTTALQTPGVSAFSQLAHWPGLIPAMRLSVSTGAISTAAALLLTLLITATFSSPAFTLLRRLLAPLIALPHAAAAIGLAFLIAPSGWIARALSPWATSWTAPPDLLTLHDPHGIALTLGLIAKELPFLLLMTIAALPQWDAPRRLQIAAAMGYGRITAFWLTTLPALYPHLRLPALAVLAYAMTNVDIATVLGPTLPPTLAVQITLWMTDPSLTQRSLASAAALLQLALTAAAILGWLGLERLAARLRHAVTLRGLRLTRLDRPLHAFTAASAILLCAALLTGLTSLALWSVAGLWPFPDTLPQSLTLTAWSSAAPALSATTLTTLIIATTATAAALILTLASLQAEHLFALPPTALPWLYLPLILPQICFLPGVANLFLTAHATGGLISVTLSHLIFVLPYVALTLTAPFRSWEPRLATIAASLGASPASIFWRLRLPMLLAPILTAAAVGLAVSVGQYLPTLLIGGGRVTTLTTEALALSSGGSRRLTGAFALLQTLLPAMGFALALSLPRLIFANRKAMVTT